VLAQTLRLATLQHFGDNGPDAARCLHVIRQLTRQAEVLGHNIERAI
jgi:hypothetical protein